ncbi:hypothetical protein PC129_g17935 [Phytophthora cactorum]|uniref:Uncharacterized protein n=1 Tax=Phytophthora cactorum TaxID=29920 RepID=A0A8T1BXQ9_9STRA|nr:hypothetical protein Pcac1_g17788 [Phytophthora cactorum]KAG2804509.1 hypothetical protein PC112_g18691 [Phytophthora cactorum]KAG2840242.1 hypothetical protein PC113_g19306 [Phytophthora cactorum]KAG2893971.1 hypothetical protein PC114_g16063 [Phytophthora cactorum]KAG2908549.1 hypothetical protein PC115_g13543 [Phytophthora cactorum]
MFGRSTSSLCRIFLCMVDYVDEIYKSKQFFHSKLAESRMDLYCAAISTRTHTVSTYNEVYTAVTNEFTASLFKT